MAGYVVDIEENTKQNEYFREVLFTAGHSQLVVMALLPGEEIGMETHQDVDQFLRIEEGEGIIFAQSIAKTNSMPVLRIM